MRILSAPYSPKNTSFLFGPILDIFHLIEIFFFFFEIACLDLLLLESMAKSLQISNYRTQKLLKFFHVLPMHSVYCTPSKCIGKEGATKYFSARRLEVKSLFLLGFPN